MIAFQIVAEAKMIYLVGLTPLFALPISLKDPLRLSKGIGWGLLGGLVATRVMDLILMGVLWVVGYDPLSCFAIVPPLKL